MTVQIPGLSPADFMAQPPDPEEELEATTPPLAMAPYDPNPLDSIAQSLRQLVQIHSGNAAAEAENDGITAVVMAARAAYDDLEAKYGSLYELLKEIETTIKPSTSKLANQVRDAIGRWRDPEVPAEVGPDAHAAEAGVAPEHPSHDAPVEEWRDFAKTMAPPYKWADIDTMNRSQIRSLLGISQPGTPVAPSVVNG
jgi:hypothetical protein